MTKPSIDRLREAFAYNAATGQITRLITGGSRPAGRVVGCLQPNGYLTARLDGSLLYCHHIAWAVVFGAWPKLIDHINGDPTDNRIENLREVTQQVNSENRRSVRSNTGFLGVYRSGDKFTAAIASKGKKFYLGTHETAQEAHAAYLKAKRELHEGNTL